MKFQTGLLAGSLNLILETLLRWVGWLLVASQVTIGAAGFAAENKEERAAATMAFIANYDEATKLIEKTRANVDADSYARACKLLPRYLKSREEIMKKLRSVCQASDQNEISEM
jgi:hypothetical protein